MLKYNGYNSGKNYCEKCDFRCSKRSNGDKHSCYKMGTYDYMKNSNKKFCEISMNLKI